MLKHFHVVLTVLCVLLAAPALAGQGSAHVALPVELQGELGGAEYKIRVPAVWNGTLLVYAHGRSRPAQPPVAPYPLIEETLLGEGYALAGSRFKNDGYAVKEGVHDTLVLTNFFRGQVGNPSRVVVWGTSMGGLITAESIEKYPGVYDAAIPLCGNVGGAPLDTDRRLAFGLAYAVAFGWPASWGSVEDISDDLTWTGVWPILSGQLPPAPENFARWEFVRLVNGIPSDIFYNSPSGFPSLVLNMWASTEVRAELEARAGGPTAQNIDHLYSLDPVDEAYVNGLLSAAGLGISAGELLDQMSNWRVAALPFARNYVEHYASLTGNIKRPVLTVHGTRDPLVPVSDEGAYADAVYSAGQQDNLVQVYTDSPLHCGFTHDQLKATVDAMMSWLDTGQSPGPSFFPVALGFDTGFVPPPPPF